MADGVTIQARGGRWVCWRYCKSKQSCWLHNVPNTPAVVCSLVVETRSFSLSNKSIWRIRKALSDSNQLLIHFALARRSNPELIQSVVTLGNVENLIGVSLFSWQAQWVSLDWMWFCGCPTLQDINGPELGLVFHTLDGPMCWKKCLVTIDVCGCFQMIHQSSLESFRFSESSESQAWWYLLKHCYCIRTQELLDILA